MDSADGHRTGPEPAAEAEKLELERPQVLPAWVPRTASPLEPAWPDEAQRERLVGPPTLPGSRGLLWFPRCGPQGWWKIQRLEPAASGERQAERETPQAQRPPVPPAGV